MVLEEAPGKVCEAFRLFLQGMGHGMYSVTVTDTFCSLRCQECWEIIAYLKKIVELTCVVREFMFLL